MNRLSRAHERYRQTTDGRATAYEFTFAKKAKFSFEKKLAENIKKDSRPL